MATCSRFKEEQKLCRIWPEGRLEERDGEDSSALSSLYKDPHSLADGTERMSVCLCVCVSVLPLGTGTYACTHTHKKTLQQHREEITLCQ